MKYDISQDSIEYSKASAQHLAHAHLFNNTLNLRKPGDLMQEDDCIDYPVTGNEKADTMVLAYCRQHSINVVLSAKPDDYISRICNKAKVCPILIPVVEEPSLGLQFTYHPAPGADEEELTFSWYGEDALSDEEYKQAYEDAKQWVDEHPGAYITSGEDVIYRGKMVQILGQLSFLEGEDDIRAKRVFEPRTE